MKCNLLNDDLLIILNVTLYLSPRDSFETTPNDMEVISLNFLSLLYRHVKKKRSHIIFERLSKNSKNTFNIPPNFWENGDLT